MALFFGKYCPEDEDTGCEQDRLRDLCKRQHEMLIKLDPRPGCFRHTISHDDYERLIDEGKQEGGA